MALLPCMKKKGNFDQSLSILEKALETFPNNTSVLFTLGAVQDKAGLKDKCIANMKRILEIDPDNASALNYIGYTYADEGIKLDEALELIQKAHSLRPDDGNIVDSLGWVYYRMGDYNKAVSLLEKAVEMTQSTSIIIDHLGDAYKKLNQYREALDAYQNALDNAGKDEAELVSKIEQKIQEIRKKIESYLQK